MKIGIITFHKANNIGAVLQASALVTFLRNENYEAEIIDYYPNNGIPDNLIIRNILRKIKRKVQNRKYRPIIEKERRFTDYIKEEYKISDTTYYGDSEIKANPPKYDILISGSDQILNTTLSGTSTSYYLDFDNNTKKISYASSFGRKEISKGEIELIRNELPKFSALSVREQSGMDIIYNEIGIKPTLVVDPVFLLDSSEWKSRCNNSVKLPEKYIFVYSMEASEPLEIVVQQIKKEGNLPVIVVRGGEKTGRIEGNEDFTCGPKEFLRYVKDAEIIVTNSFHGTAFSLIFKKKFLCIAHSKRNARLEGILTLTENEKKLIRMTDKNIEFSDYIINGEDAYKHLEGTIENSKNYLKQSLQGDD